MLLKKLNIEIILESVEILQGKEFSLKFIDPNTNLFKVIKFNESSEDLQYHPEAFENRKYKDYIAPGNKKFLQRIVFLMTLTLDEL